nr:uncharacterized mitochondrial protein AtMg00810-like [Tanacetum cinerariifolium]
MEDWLLVYQSKYIKEMLKKFRFDDSKPNKTSMSTEIKLTKDDEADSVDSTKYRGWQDEGGVIGGVSFGGGGSGVVLGGGGVVAREGLEIQDNHQSYVLSKVVLESMTTHLEVWPVGLR